jgi:DNA-binding CsgD family transcriptional regulator
VCHACGQPTPQQTAPDRGRYHLTAPEVARIRAQIRMGKTDTQIAETFGVAPMTVYSIRRRKTWSA